MSLLEEKLSFTLLHKSAGSMSGVSLLFSGSLLLAAHTECSRGGCKAKQHGQRGVRLEQWGGSSNEWLIPMGWIYMHLGNHNYLTSTRL